MTAHCQSDSAIPHSEYSQAHLLHLLFQRADVEPFLLDEVHHRFLPLPLLLLVEPTTLAQDKHCLPSQTVTVLYQQVGGATCACLALPCLRQPNATVSG